MSISIIDMGSARIKQLISKELNGNIVISNFKEETKLSSYLINDNISDEGIDILFSSLKSCIERIRDNGVSNYIVVATEIFRKAKNGFEILSNIKNQLNCTPNLLDPKIEGEIFFESINNKMGINESESCLIDVGGGSVQIIYRNNTSIISSIGTGTFFLEKQFQGKFPASSSELDMMKVFVKEELQKAIPISSSKKILIFGSNCMEDFIKSSLNRLGKNDSFGKYTIEDIQYLFDNIILKEFDDIKNYYPENQGFMYGADKALLNVLVIAEFFKSDYIIPTNESVSTGLAYLAINNSEYLFKNGIEISAI